MWGRLERADEAVPCREREHRNRNLARGTRQVELELEELDVLETRLVGYRRTGAEYVRSKR